MKIGVIGGGAWGKNLVREFAAMNVLHGVADAIEANRSLAQDLAPDIAIYDDHKALIASDLDAVAIATPAPTHFAIAKEAMEAGLDVFVEKPLTLNVGEAESLCEMAQRFDRILMVGHLLLFQPAIEFVSNYLREGKLGELRTLHQRRSKLGRARSVENVMWSFGVHDIAVLLHLAGESPSKVVASGHAAITDGVEDDVYVHLTFPSGVMAHLHTSWLWPKTERGLLVVGDRGILEYDEMTQQVILHKKTITKELTIRDDGSEVLFEGDGQPLRLELEHFVECCQSRQTPRASGAGGLSVVQVLHQAEQYLKSS